MATKVYPIWKPGAPQLRIFFPDFPMILLKPKEKTVAPPNQVMFKVHMKMTAIDVKNYLQKIYQVPAVDVRTEVIRPDEMKHPVTGHDYRPPDYKVAYVLLDKAHSFKFPDIYPEAKEIERKKQDSEYSDMIDKMREKNLKNWDRAGAPSWFSV